MPHSPNVSRRELLFAGTAVAGGALFAGCHPSATQPTPAALDDENIDAHCHVWSPDTVRYPLGHWATKESMRPASFTAEELLHISHSEGIGRAVLVQHSPLYGYDPSYMVDCWRRFPGVFSIVGRIDERLSDLPTRLRNLREQGVRGLRINPNTHGDRTPVADPPNWLKADAMQALWKQAQEANIALCPLIPAEFLPSLDRMCEQFPQAKCVVDHLGQVTLSNAEQEKNLLRLARHREVYVKVSAFYKFGEKRPPYSDLLPFLRRVVEAFGPARLLWGSDCPYQLQEGHNYAASLGLLRERAEFLSPADLQTILRDTAARLFFS